MERLYQKLFNSLSNRTSEERDQIMRKAGYFETSLKDDVSSIPSYDPKFLTTPFESLLVPQEPEIVLLCTGSFAPMHDGHVSMIQTAVDALNEKYNVIGVFVAPDHDEYVLTKDGTQIFSAEDRIQMAGDIIEKHNKNWLIDPWSAMYSGHSLNFTEVRQRLQEYLQTHLKRSMEVAFVFGADNADFTLVLEGIPHVCVSRNGKRSHNLTLGGIWANHDQELISSTEIRRELKKKALKRGPSL